MARGWNTHYDKYDIHFRNWKLGSIAEIWATFVWYVDLSEADYNMLTDVYYSEDYGFFWDNGVIKDYKSDCIGAPSLMGMLTGGHKAETVFGVLHHCRKNFEDVYCEGVYRLPQGG